MKHILIIDDDIHINNMLDDILQQEGYRVSHAYSGTEALLFLSKSKPDLILLDLMLPGLSGEEILPQITDIPVIVMSAKVDIQDKVSLLLNGAVDYVTKPFEINELLARIVVQFRKISNGTAERALEYGDILLNTSTHSSIVFVLNIPLISALTSSTFSGHTVPSIKSSRPIAIQKSFQNLGSREPTLI